MSRKSLCSFQGSRPVKLSGGVPFLDCAHSIAPCAHSVNPFLKKIFWGNFFKDNENARARRGSQSRRKQAKTGVLSTEKFFEKIRKKRAKKIFSVVLHPYFLRFSPSVAPSVPADRQGDSGQSTPSDVVLKTIWYRVIHREKWLSTGFST